MTDEDMVQLVVKRLDQMPATRSPGYHPVFRLLLEVLHRIERRVAAVEEDRAVIVRGKRVSMAASRAAELLSRQTIFDFDAKPPVHSELRATRTAYRRELRHRKASGGEG